MDRVAEYYRQVRAQTEKIAAPLKPEDAVVQPAEDVSPPKWHLAHTSWFFEQFILKNTAGYQPFHPDFNFLFNSYYESMGERVVRSERGGDTRPVLQEVLDYRKYVDEHMAPLLNNADEQLKELVELGLNHEQQHQELLLTDIKYIFGKQPLLPTYIDNGEQKLQERREADWLTFDEGIYEVGFDGKGFAFDNEYGRHKVFLHAFRIADQPVTNSDWLEFMGEGGYSDFRLWLSDGWAWVNLNKINAPDYWHESEGQWFHFTLHGLQPVDPAAPVTHISYYEAEAYARWKGMRLPTEAEWEVAAIKTEKEIDSEAGFSDSGIYQPVNTGARFSGNVWEWTGSAYLPYPYYKQEEGALGEYNGKWMSGQMVLRGGSCATPKSHYRHTYRNFFQPEKRWQFTGLRLAEYI